MLFPTRFKKAEISSRLSYPVGAELISSELADVPQAESLEIGFYSLDQRVGSRSEPYDILSVFYIPQALHTSGWKIEVRPVPRELKHIVRGALQAEFFPRIREWLKARAGFESWYGSDGCGVIFDEKHEPMLKWRDRTSMRWRF